MSSPRKTQFGKFLLVLFALASILITVAFAEGGPRTAALLRARSGLCCPLWWQSFWP